MGVEWMRVTHRGGIDAMTTSQWKPVDTMLRHLINIFQFIVLILLFTLATGCTTTNFTQPVASFQDSINTSSATIGIYYSSLNTFERQLYLDELALDPTQKVQAKDRSGHSTPLLGQYFQAESIKARMDALALLGVYAQQLTDLASSNAPKRFSTNATVLGQSLAKLDKTFSQLSGKMSDPTASAYVGPISALIGSVGKMYLERQRDRAIREAVNNGTPKVNEILNLLEHDLIESVKPLQETGLKEELASRVHYYNDHRNRHDMDLRQRRALLKEIDAQATAYEAAIAFNPSELIQSIRQANNALVRYANTPQNPQNFSDLLEALNAFDQNAQEIAGQVRLIRQATGE
ncbi:MAG: hypothetical protein ACYC9S_03345 [Leptospirales bacterium]